jgi:hypothetical protein
MVIDKSTPYGAINVSMEAIANVAGEAALECYGVVGLASKNSLRENINELLKKDDYIKGVYCKKVKNAYEVDVYVVVAYGVKITEVISRGPKESHLCPREDLSDSVQEGQRFRSRYQGNRIVQNEKHQRSTT